VLDGETSDFSDIDSDEEFLMGSSRSSSAGDKACPRLRAESTDGQRHPAISKAAQRELEWRFDPDEELAVWARSDAVLLHIHSRAASTPFGLSSTSVVRGKLPKALPGWCVRLVAAAGMKSSDAPAPCQDAFSCTCLLDGWILCIVCDGHGEHGDVVSERVAQSIPMLFSQHIAKSMEVEEALHIAFMEAQSDLEKNFSEEQVYSGTTVAAYCHNLERQQTWIAHTGDSKVVLGDLTNGQLAFSTEDHKAHVPPEGLRLKEAGAQVVEKRFPKGEIMSRVFVPRTGVPGLAMSRSLGDGCLKKYGVTAEPEVADVSSYWNSCKEPVVVVASDGVWHVTHVGDVLEGLAARRASGQDLSDGAEVMVRQAQNLWIEEDDYCDDTTLLLMAPNMAKKLDS